MNMPNMNNMFNMANMSNMNNSFNMDMCNNMNIMNNNMNNMNNNMNNMLIFNMWKNMPNMWNIWHYYNTMIIPNLQKDNSMINNINSPIIIYCHPHPLIRCLTEERKKYGNTWLCNICQSPNTYDIPSFYCTFCDFDICNNCMGKCPLSEIKIFDYNDNSFINIESNNNFNWQQKYINHKHLLTFVKRTNKNFSWRCNNCYNVKMSENPSYYCSLCDYDICEDCFKGINPMIPNPQISFPNIYPVFPFEYCLNRKPVIYLYPEKAMDISVQLDLKIGKFLTVYPKFNEKNTWKVNAEPNGNIKMNNKIYPYLFWEAESYILNETKEGFIVKNEDAETFLEEKLKILGLNDKESTDFITYWLPVLIKNKLSLCAFQKEKFFDNYKLNINPAPDTLIRIFLCIKKIEAPINVKEQELKSMNRKGFTVIEWGGTNI